MKKEKNDPWVNQWRHENWSHSPTFRLTFTEYEYEMLVRFLRDIAEKEIRDKEKWAKWLHRRIELSMKERVK